MLKTHVLMFLVVYFLALCDHSFCHDHVLHKDIRIKETNDQKGLLV
jgi:hypothetical protein